MSALLIFLGFVLGGVAIAWLIIGALLRALHYTFGGAPSRPIAPRRGGGGWIFAFLVFLLILYFIGGSGGHRAHGATMGDCVRQAAPCQPVVASVSLGPASAPAPPDRDPGVAPAAPEGTANGPASGTAIGRASGSASAKAIA